VRFPPFFRGIRAAFFFLTRIPVGGWPYSPADWKWSAAHFPFVGALLGVAVGSVARACSPLGALAAALVALVASLMLTGAFHEDGLADTADALGGGATREKVFIILKDSRIGSYGASALVLSLTLRAALIAALLPNTVFALAWSMGAARVGPIWLMAAIPYAGDEAASKSTDLRKTTVWQALVATGWMLVVGALGWRFGHLSLAKEAAGVALCIGFTWLSGYRYVRRVGGITGDFLGATEQLCEASLLACLAWGACNGGCLR
jgi:adenosylcobinamide-GDP ribazoletransferase